MATTSILSDTQSMKRRRRHPIMDAHKMIPATVWIFILLFVIVVFLALLPATPTGTTTTTTSVAGVKETTTNHNNNNNKNNNKNKNHHKSAVEKLHDATSGLGRTLRKVVQTKREEFQHALAGLTTHDTTAGGGIGIGGNVMPHRLKALRDKHEVIGERLMAIQQGRETAEELLHRGGRSSQTFSLQDKQAHIHDLVQAKLLQKKKREKKKLKKINHNNNNKDDKGNDKDEENGNVVAKDPEQQIQEKLMKKQKLQQKIQKKMEQKFELLQLQQEDEGNFSDKRPMKMNEIITYLSNWIHYLHENLKMRQIQHSTLYELIWKTYHDITIQTLYPWDQEYIQRMPERRDDDDSIFLSLISYRDEHCFHTLYDAYAKAKHPELLFVGLIQQVCREDCRRSSTSTTSSTTTTTVEEVPPDDDCFQLFCDSDLGQKYCNNNNDEGNHHHVRVLDIKDSESLGPYMTKFMASKLWKGENWYMHLDLYNNNNNNNNIMTFVKHWDTLSINMLEKAPSKRPIISYSPSTTSSSKQEQQQEKPSRLCGSVFAKSDLENQIIQLEEEEEDGGSGNGSSSKKKKKDGEEEQEEEEYPLFASFIASGYFITNSRFLQEVPFDPFLPWIFMGEEILMSSRLWTAGYDIFTPTQSIVYYDERHRRTHGGHGHGHGHQKSNFLLLLFWESIHRIFTRNVHNSFQMFLLDRIKYQLGYPEASEDLLPDRTLLTAVESYTMGSRRSLHWYLKLIGLNMTTKEISNTYWCEGGFPPPGFEQYNDLYSNGVVKKNETVIQWMEEVFGSEDDETTSGAMTDDLEDDDEAVEDANTDHGDADAKEEEEVEQAEDDNDDDDNGVDETASEEDDDKTK